METCFEERFKVFKSVFRVFGSVAAYLRGACSGVVGGEKSKFSENFRNFRKVVKWSEMHGDVILGGCGVIWWM